MRKDTLKKNFPRKSFPYSLSGVHSKCISDSIALSFENTGCVILKRNLLLFLIHVCFFKTSDHENFLALRICPLNNLSLYLCYFSHNSNLLQHKKSVFRADFIKTQYRFFVMIRIGVNISMCFSWFYI